MYLFLFSYQTENPSHMDQYEQQSNPFTKDLNLQPLHSNMDYGGDQDAFGQHTDDPVHSTHPPGNHDDFLSSQVVPGAIQDNQDPCFQPVDPLQQQQQQQHQEQQYQQQQQHEQYQQHMDDQYEQDHHSGGQSGNFRHSFHDDGDDLPANFAREPAKNEQYQMRHGDGGGRQQDEMGGDEEDSYDEEEEGGGERVEGGFGYDQNHQHQQQYEGEYGGGTSHEEVERSGYDQTQFDARSEEFPQQSQVGVSNPNPNPFDVADGLLAAQRGGASGIEDEPSMYDNAYMDKENQPLCPPGQHDPIMEGMTSGAYTAHQGNQGIDDRFADVGADDNDACDDDEDADSVTENTNTADHHFEYGKMEEEDIAEEIPKDDVPESKEEPVSGIDNQAFNDDQEDSTHRAQQQKEYEDEYAGHPDQQAEMFEQQSHGQEQEQQKYGEDMDGEGEAFSQQDFEQQQQQEPDSSEFQSQGSGAVDTGHPAQDVVEEKYTNEFAEDDARVPGMAVCEPCGGQYGGYDDQEQVPDFQSVPQNHEDFPVVHGANESNFPAYDSEEDDEGTGVDPVQSETNHYDQIAAEHERFEEDKKVVETPFERKEQQEQFDYKEQEQFEYRDDQDAPTECPREEEYEEEKEIKMPTGAEMEEEMKMAAANDQFSQPAFSGQDYGQQQMQDFDHGKAEQEEDEIIQDRNEFVESEIPAQASEYSQYTEQGRTTPDTTNMSEVANANFHADSEGFGPYDQEVNENTGETMDQSANDQFDDDHLSRAPPTDIDSQVTASCHEEEKSYVDNLESELVSPAETIPQPLPSPPEPRTISDNFDPLVPDSTSSSPPRSPSLENQSLEHEREYYDQTASEGGSVTKPVYQNEALTDMQTPPAQPADFLTAGEVEGETKFGVDGSAITKSSSLNNHFMASESDESPQMEYDYNKQELEMMAANAVTTETTATTETETETSEKTDPGVTDQYGNDNALMSMSMEGSFYEDGGDLIGGDDATHVDKMNTNNIMYQSAITEESEPSCSFSPRQESLLRNEQQFTEQQTEREKPREIFEEENDYEAREDGLGRTSNALDDEPQIQISQDSSTEPIASGFEESSAQPNNVVEQPIFDQQEFDHQQPVNGITDAKDPMDFLMDAPVTDTGLQTPVIESSSNAGFESCVDVRDTQAPIGDVGSFESSSVDVMDHTKPVNGFAVDEEMSRDFAEKVESAGASTVCVPEAEIVTKEEVAVTASSQPLESAAIPDAAAAAAVIVPEAKSSATPEKPAASEEKKKTSSAKKTTPGSTAALAKKTTTTTLTKKTTTTAKTGDSATKTPTTSTTKSATTTKSAASTTSKTATSTTRASSARPPSATKKTDPSPRPSTTPRTSSPTKKPSSTDSKTAGTAADKKSPKTATSPTKAPAKTSTLPSYAQPITPRKPREAKPPSADAAKRPGTAGSTRSPRPTSTPRTRPASATTRTTASSITRTTTTPTSERPKTSPTKLANGE